MYPILTSIGYKLSWKQCLVIAWANFKGGIILALSLSQAFPGVHVEMALKVRTLSDRSTAVCVFEVCKGGQRGVNLCCTCWIPSKPQSWRVSRKLSLHVASWFPAHALPPLVMVPPAAMFIFTVKDLISYVVCECASQFN